MGPMLMTLGELKRLVSMYTSPESDNLEVKVWLPGSTIRLSPMSSISGLLRRGDTLLIEGNVDPGSMLGEE